MHTHLPRSTGAESRLAWQLLSLVAEENNLDLQRHLRRAIGKWSRAGKLTRPLLSAVCSHVESEENLNVSTGTVRPVLMATCIQRPPGHFVMSPRCTGDCRIFAPRSKIQKVLSVPYLAYQVAYNNLVAPNTIVCQ